MLIGFTKSTRRINLDPASKLNLLKTMEKDVKDAIECGSVYQRLVPAVLAREARKAGISGTLNDS